MPNLESTGNPSVVYGAGTFVMQMGIIMNGENHCANIWCILHSSNAHVDIWGPNECTCSHLFYNICKVRDKYQEHCPSESEMAINQSVVNKFNEDCIEETKKQLSERGRGIIDERKGL